MSTDVSFLKSSINLVFGKDHKAKESIFILLILDLFSL